MTYFVIQVRAKSEAKYIEKARPILLAAGIDILWPRRTLRLKRRGRWFDTHVPIFPGYLFLQAEVIPPDIYWALRKIEGFIQFLKNNQDVDILPENEARVLIHLLQYGEIVRKSTASFDENNKIQIIEGPLKGLEGKIVKVDRRKGRAKIKLDLYDESYLVDFGFESISLKP